MNPEWITVAQAAKVIGRSESTVRDNMAYFNTRPDPDKPTRVQVFYPDVYEYARLRDERRNRPRIPRPEGLDSDADITPVLNAIVVMPHLSLVKLVDIIGGDATILASRARAWVNSQ